MLKLVPPQKTATGARLSVLAFYLMEQPQKKTMRSNCSLDSFSPLWFI